MNFKSKLVQNTNLAFLSVKMAKSSEDAKLPLITDFKFLFLLSDLFHICL